MSEEWDLGEIEDIAFELVQKFGEVFNKNVGKPSVSFVIALTYLTYRIIAQSKDSFSDYEKDIIRHAMKRLIASVDEAIGL